MALAGVVLVVLFVAGLTLALYAAGSLQAAVRSGARAGGGLDGSVESCVETMRIVLRGEGGLLAGRAGSGLTTSCELGSETATATAVVHVPSPVPFLPDLVVTRRASVLRELPP